MPKVLRIINRFNLGGPTYNAAYLTKYLSPEFETLLIGGAKDDTEESSEFILKNLGVDYRIISEMKRPVNLMDDYSAYKKIKKIIREFKPDIVHTHAAKAGALGRWAAFACDVPVIVHTFHGHVFHSYFGKLKSTFYKSIERNLARKSSAIVAISEIQKHELTSIHKIASSDKVHVIPLGFDLKRFNQNHEEKRINFRTKYNLEEDEIAIGIVGRLVPVKNHVLFLEAIKYSKQNSTKKIKAFVIGGGEEMKNLISLTSRLKLNDSVIFTSWEKEVDKVYPGLDIVCLTSFNEGTPVSLIEAQAASKPIVSTNVGGIENVVIPDITAFLSDVSDKETFWKNLLKLINEDTLRNEMGKKGWNHVHEKFGYIRLQSDMKKLYNDLMKQT